MRMILNLKQGIQKALFFVFFLFCSTVMVAQNKVSGIVQDATGEPLIGVSILEVGTNNGTVTDIDGKFSLTVNRGAKISFSYVGYTPQTLAATNSMTVVMQEDSKLLNEVVVVGYGTMRRKDVTSSITTVKSEDLNKGVFTDPASMLQGKVAGLTVTTSGDPSGTPSITLRGASSLRTGDAMQPYYVIDGIPGVDISMVAPDDIESIDVLRDASATAIYGSKAANGVIIITTKSGQEGKTNVTYNGYVAFDNVLKTLDMASASQLRSSGLIGAEQDGGGDTDWQDEVLRTGFSHNHNVSISGGNAKTKYMGSVNYMNREGVVRGTGMNRVNARSLLTTKILKDRLELSLGLNAMQGKHKGVPMSGGGSSNSGKSVLDAMNYYSPTNPVKNADGTWYESYVGSANYNPLSMIYEDGNENEWKRLQFITKASMKIVEGLVWHVNYSYDSGQNTYSWYQTHQTQMEKGYNGRAHRDTYLRHNQTFETYGNYDVTLNKVHKLGLMAGYSWEERTNGDGFGVTVNNFYNDVTGFWNLRYANNINGITDVTGSSKATIRNISFYGRANYSFNSRYMLQATIRRDGSSVFGADHKWGTFPSVSAAWNITEEDFMKNQSVFDQLKLRVGYGVSGNAMGFGAYDAIATYGLNSNSFEYILPDGTKYTMYGIEAQNNPNPDLKWERTSMLNIGLDFAFLGGRINGSIEYYNKKTSDLIWNYAVSTSVYPLNWIRANVGDITNNGVEFTINAIPVKTKDFQWQTTLNLSHNRNTVDKLSNSTYSVDYVDYGNPNIGGIASNADVQRIMEGEPLGTFWTYRHAGYDTNGNSVFYVGDLEKHKDGEGKIQPDTYQDADGNWVTSNPGYDDKANCGNAQPKLVYGWSNTLNYKNWSLTAFFQGVLGNKILNATKAHYSFQGHLAGGKNVLAEMVNDKKWQADANAHIPGDNYIENGSYLRLSTLTLGYTFKELGGWAQSMQLYATCNNLLTITGYSGIDPEVNLGGLDPGIDYRETFYPHTRSFIIGAKINF
ncbi:iron complex outermembrane recepter protein [Prevotella aff. ruminicola Tc2-24]|uniref:Iron complex outermembrane recepter protein n=1 Tax=Prevotella aff. ruminicola Tc2-24 TaxID=81582 RepID=A0A1I0NFW1_9BACT|nr:TonB-dependent receptor [Prevotella aff. ruminicola Tc2-24]SEW00138.1 iron complex outermembrane recepter protein [Prevotella aff. ruminicola Tc2-24]